jgi:probable HAF family extracellular repeat protein
LDWAAFGINDGGVIVGYDTTAAGYQHAVSWGLYIGETDLGTL